ncbi:MAG: hypothetical protein ABEJ70_00215 [Halobacteriaceae archaeon]
MSRSRVHWRRALAESLRDWRRHAGALGVVGAALAAAVALGSREAYYFAALTTFTVWMAWFVLTAVATLDRLDA